jgi:DNA-binding MarR family transcriptional regulator
MNDIDDYLPTIESIATLRAMDLTRADFYVLAMLSSHPQPCVMLNTELALHVPLSPDHIAKSIRSLSERGIIEVSGKRDSREIRVLRMMKVSFSKGFR